MGEWMARVSFYAVAVDPASLSLEWKGLGVATVPELLEFMRQVGCRGPPYRLRRRPLRHARRVGESPQLGRFPSVPLSRPMAQVLLYDKYIAFYFFAACPCRRQN